jgi:hypothetical protein
VATILNFKIILELVKYLVRFQKYFLNATMRLEKLSILSIDAHGLKIQGRVHKVFAKSLEGRYVGAVIILDAGYTFILIFKYPCD